MKYLILTLLIVLGGCATTSSCWDLDDFRDRARCVEREKDMDHYRDRGWRTREIIAPARMN